MATPTELLAALEAESWDVVLLVEGGASLTTAVVSEAAHRHDPQLPVIVVAETGGEGPAVAAMRHGAADFVVRNDAVRLVAAVQRVVGEAARRNGSTQAAPDLDDGAFRMLAERSLQGLLVHSAGVPLYVNPAFAELLGYDDRAELLGLSDIFELVYPDDREWVRDYVRQRTAGGDVPERYEVRALRRDGSTAWMDCSASTIPWRGEPVHLVAIMDISARKEFQLRLERQEALLQQVIDRIPHLIFATDAESRFVLVNQAVLETSNLSKEELIGRTIAELAGRVPVKPEVTLASDRSILVEGADQVDLIEPIVTPEGGEGFVRTLKVPLRDAQGQVWGVIGMVEDITERRRLEAELELDRARLADAIESAPAAVYYCDAEGRLEVWNSKVLEFFPEAATVVHQGLPYSEFLRSIVLLFKDRPTDPDVWLRRRMAQMGQLGREGLEVNLVDGRTFLVQDRKTLAGGTVVIVMDITERKQAEAALAASEANFRSLIELAPDAIFISDQQGRILHVNPAASELTGYSEAELRSLAISDLISPDDLDGEPLRMDVLFGGQTLLSERRFRRKDGSEVVVENSVNLRPDGKLQGVVRDISLRRRAEEELRASQRLLQAVFDTLPLSLFVKDADARYVIVNRRIEEAWGVSSDEIAGHRVDFFSTVPEAEGASEAEHDTLILSGSVPRIEHIGTATYSDGSEHIVRTVKRPLTDETGRIYGLVGFSEDVTDLERAQRSLRESQGLLQSVFDTIPHRVFVKDVNSRYLMVNRAFAQSMAMTSDSLLGQNLTSAMLRPEHERERTLAVDRAILLGELSRSDEVYHLRYADGVLRTMRVLKAPLRDELGRIYGLVGVGEDITPLHEAEARAEVAHTRLADAVQNLEAAFYLYDSDERLVLWNDKVVDFFPNLRGKLTPGMPFEALLRLATPIVDVPEEAFEAQVAQRLDEFRSPPPQPIEQHLRDGRWLLVRDRKTATGDTVSLRQDITTLKRSEQALRVSEERFRMLTENAPDVIFRYSLGPRTGFDYVSPVATATIGYTPAEHYADPELWLRITHPDDLEEQRRLFQVDEESSGGLVLVRWRYKDADWVWIEERCTPVLDEQGRMVAIEGIVRDVTSRKELESQLLQAQRMEAVGQLAGGIAHDFNNMLSVMGSYSTFVLEQLDQDHPARDDVKVIQDAVGRSSTLTRQLLALSRKQVMQLERVDLNTLLMQMEKILRRVIGEDVVLESRLDPQLGAVTADPVQIEQIVMNLAVNARDAMPDGGTLSIETDAVTVESEPSQPHLDLTPGRYVMMALTDTGTGMAPEVREHIFEPFFTTKDVGKGTGLGLATVYGIVKQMQGDIWVESALSKGTTFKIFLPRAVGDTKAATAAEVSHEGMQGSETILLVEDEELVRVAAHRILENHGYRVIAANTARDALDLYAQGQLAIDLLLTDVVMPEISGPQLVERLTKERPGLRVLYMTGYTERTLRHHMGSDRLADVIRKPFSPEVLLRTVRKVLRNPEE